MEETKNTSEDLYIHHLIKVDPGQTSIRIDKYLLEKIEKISRNRIQNAIKAGAVLVNNKIIKSNYKVRPNEEIKVVLPNPPSIHESVKPEDIPLDIHYEDDALLIVNKPSGMVVHPGTGNHSGTLVNGLMHYFESKALPVLDGNLPDRPGLVHRIDKETSGLLVIAKTEEAMTFLSKQFYDHSIEREYHAIVWGNFEEDKGTIDCHIGRHPKDRIKMHGYPDGDVGKHAVTHYEVIKDYYYISLIKCRLETGRTHQIRVHMKHLGHTLFNDERYGGDKIIKGTVYSKYKQFVHNAFKLIPGHALHAKLLGFTHPRTGERMVFEQPLPDYFQELVKKWHNYVEGKKNR